LRSSRLGLGPTKGGVHQFVAVPAAIAIAVAATFYAGTVLGNGLLHASESPITNQQPPVSDGQGLPAKPDAKSADQEYELILRDGRIITGRLIEKTEEHVIFTVGGVATKFPLRSVDRIKELPTVEARYAALKTAIDPTDASGLMRLAQWLHSHDRYDLALTEINLALKADPGNPDAQELKRLISEQKKLVDASKAAGEKRNKAETPADLASTPDPDGDPEKKDTNKSKQPLFPLLTDEQINVIRVYEVSLSDPPKMTIPQPVIEAFLDKFGGQRADGNAALPQSEQGRRIYLRKKPVEILADMFALKAREFYPQVKVIENPKSMQIFRDQVNKTWLINSCATTKCHGGEEAGRLRLYNQKAASDVAAYTNFLILERFRVRSADNKDPIPLIDYNEPANSPLLQMGLPRSEAKFQHPALSAKSRLRPAFQSEKDERFVQAVDWIKAMYAKRTEYPVDYTPPSGRPPSNQETEPGER